MSNRYLPELPSIDEACKWLQEETCQTWALSRLLESELVPWFWLDFNARYPAAFGRHVEGYLAPMGFAPDRHRLKADRTDALVNRTLTHDGIEMKIEPGLRVSMSDLRFKREDVQHIAAATLASQNPSPATDGRQAAPESAEHAPVASKPPQAVAKRRDLLTPVIDAALRECGDQADAAAVWPVLVRYAKEGRRPLIGVSEDGIKWEEAFDGAQFFTLKHLRDRLRRRAEKAR